MVVKGYVKVSLLIALVLFGFAGTADAAFYFRGYTYNETNVTLNNTNISIEAYTFGGTGPQLMGTDYNSSNATGFFNVSVTTNDNPAYFYKIVIKHFVNNATSGTLDYIGQALPQFPQMMVSTLTVSSPMNFYLRRGGTININATNGTSNIAFKYMIKDTRLGYGITDNFTVEQLNVGPLHVPLERNYSIMIFPNQSLPISYDLNNLSTYTNTNYTANITFNTSIIPRWVSGYANLSDGSSNFTNLTIIAYLMEPGNIIGKDRPMPSNMSAFRGDGSSDRYNATNGSYNITLPGSAQGAGANILLFATAKNGSNYYGAFRNITMNYSNSNVTNFNFTLWQLLGRAENISVQNVGIMANQNITTNQTPFQLINESGGTNITNKFAHIEIEVNYSANSSAAFKWMVDVSQTANGSFSIPAISANIRKINVFMQDFAPIKTSKNATQLATQPVNINMTSFNNKKPDGGNLSGIFIDMLLSKPECDRPVPAAGCSLMPDPTNGTAEGAFDPFKIVLGGGKISLRIKQTSTRITVHYKNVDMLASGPPDALFDENASQAQSGSALEQAWRFGSKGPEIYDELLIGVPISGANISKVYLGKLYDENWNATWNTSAGGTLDNLPSDYSTFNATWFNSTTGMPCSTTDNSSACYIDTTNGTLWFRIPHFSGVGPTVVSSVVGNVTVNLTNSTGIAERNVVMNFIVNDTVNATSFYNITFPGGFNASLAVVSITINGTVDPANWNKTKGTLFVNVSRNGTHAATAGVIQYINLSNVTLPSATGNHTINVTTNNSITVSVNYTVVAYNVSLTNVSGYALTNTTTAGVNSTYYLNLTNNGTAADSFTITVDNVSNAYYAATNISTVALDAGQTRVFTLNVTNTTASTVYVNVTATSVNDSTRFSYINTTTTVNGTVYGASLTVTTASQTTNARVNASYTLTLQNNGTLTDTYNLTVDNGSASTAALNVSGDITLNASATRTIILNVTNTSSGVFRVNVTARSNNDSTKFAYINTTTTVPVVITASPANGSTNNTGYVNVTVTLDAQGWAQYLNWQGTNYSMTPSTPQSAGTVFYRNMTVSLSGNYSFRIYANDSNANNASETRIITVNRTNTTSLAANISLTTFIVNTTINITSPSGNVTVTIPNNTNASVSGAALTNVSIDSIAQVNSTFATNMSSSDVFIGENLTLGPDGAQFSPDIQLNLSYTDAQLTAAGISESQISVKFYNTTTNTWVTQTTYSQSTAGNYIIVNVSHFSTFALLGTTTTTTTTGGGSSGSTGGGGVVSSEPFANIEKSERYDRNLIANSPVTYTFKVPEHGIYEIAVTGSASENDIAIRVEALKGTSKLATVAPPGTAYKNLNILAGTKRIKEVLIRFKVENSWLTGNNFAGSDVKLVKWDGSKWVQLETSEKTKDAGFTYFEAKGDSFSSFAITSLKGVAAPTATATPVVVVTETGAPTATATPAPTAVPTEKATGFELVLAAVTVCAAYLLGRKRR